MRVYRQLVDKYAKALATNPEMWGGNLPLGRMATLLENKCREHWTRAVRIMLRHWEVKPLFQDQTASNIP